MGRVEKGKSTFGAYVNVRTSGYFECVARNHEEAWDKILSYAPEEIMHDMRVTSEDIEIENLFETYADEEYEEDYD